MTNYAPIPSIPLLDGTRIPWLGWGNGTGEARADALRAGKLAIDAGIRHIDTAQIYKTEEATGQIVSGAPLPRDEIYVTSKRTSFVSLTNCSRKKSVGGKVPLDQVRQSIESSVKKLGSIPDLFLIHNPSYYSPGELKALWQIFEALKDEGKLKSIGVSNSRVQDLEIILDGAKHKPVVNQVVSIHRQALLVPTRLLF